MKIKLLLINIILTVLLFIIFLPANNIAAYDEVLDPNSYDSLYDFYNSPEWQVTNYSLFGQYSGNLASRDFYNLTFNVSFPLSEQIVSPEFIISHPEIAFDLNGSPNFGNNYFGIDIENDGTLDIVYDGINTYKPYAYHLYECSNETWLTWIADLSQYIGKSAVIKAQYDSIHKFGPPAMPGPVFCFRFRPIVENYDIESLDKEIPKIDHYPDINDWNFFCGNQYIQSSSFVESIEDTDRYLVKIKPNIDECEQTETIISSRFTINDEILLFDVMDAASNAFVGIDIDADGILEFWKKEPGMWQIYCGEYLEREAVIVLIKRIPKNPSPAFTEYHGHYNYVSISPVFKKPMHPLFAFTKIFILYACLPAAFIIGVIIFIRRNKKRKAEIKE